MKKHILIIAVLILIAGCTVGPKPINFGSDGCHFCRMTIVDKQYAAQFVNQKGKAYNFDAAECMINYLNGVDNEDVGLLLVTDYSEPESLIKAEEATFIISEDMPSPMGANLSSVNSIEAAEKLLADKEGVIYNWNELRQYFKNL